MMGQQEGFITPCMLKRFAAHRPKFVRSYGMFLDFIPGALKRNVVHKEDT
jgi:hypothetical protein